MLAELGILMRFLQYTLHKSKRTSVRNSSFMNLSKQVICLCYLLHNNVSLQDANWYANGRKEVKAYPFLSIVDILNACTRKKSYTWGVYMKQRRLVVHSSMWI